jgi:TonB family protein
MQHVRPDQQDNPNAHLIADQANHVDQETQSHLTNHEQDEQNPTPGGQHAGPTPDPGNSERTRIAANDTHAGEQNRAPGERGQSLTLVPAAPPSPQPASTTLNPPSPQPPPAPPHAGDNHPAAANPAPPAPAAPPAAPGGATQAAPPVEDSPNGNWSFNPAPMTGTGVGAAPTAGPGAAAHPPQAVSPAPTFGLGARSAPGQMNFNLNQQAVAQIVGHDQLRRDRESDGERRRSEHRGSWMASNFERWRSSIENYLPSVRDGNQTALNTAAVPFGTYLNLMHNRIHPIFAESASSSPAFLESLDALPANSPLNDRTLVTRLEIVLTKDGQLKRMGVVRTSGITAFDIAALDSVNRAAPFGPAPAAIVSPDGNVYLHWEFHRDEVYACSTMNARPYILKGTPTGPGQPSPAPPGAPPAPQERGVPQPGANPNDVRTGSTAPLPSHAPSGG